MSFLDAELWGPKQWVIFLVVVVAALGAAFVGGLMTQRPEIQELRTRIETSNEGFNSREKLRLEEEQKEWSARRAEEEKRLDGLRVQLDADRNEHAKQLDLGRQNEQRIEENVRRIREESETWMLLAKILLFGVLPICTIAAFVAVGWWHKKLRKELREDDLEEKDEIRAQRQQQGHFIENAQRSQLAAMAIDKLKENPEAMERALRLLFSTKPQISSVPPVGSEVDPNSGTAVGPAA